jgi:hypothetical protein
MGRTKRLVASLFASGLFAVGIAAPASAQPNVDVGPGGLVNVQIVDAVDIGDVTVQVPVAVAANVCDVDAPSCLQRSRTLVAPPALPAASPSRASTR